MDVLIVADGDIPTREALDRRTPSGGFDLVIAADGGALKATALGIRPDVVVGDFDSLAPEDLDAMRTNGIELIVHPVSKDESDTQLAIGEAVRRGATGLLLIGAFGGSRLEHTVGNLLLLGLPELAGIDARIADDVSEIRLLDGERTLTIDGQRGDFVSLFPLTPVVDGVTTDGLAYPLVDEALTQGPARGLSNVMDSDRATVSARRGRLLVIHTRRER